MRLVRPVALSLAFAALAALAACSGSSSGGRPAPATTAPAPAGAGPSWLVTKAALTSLSDDPAARDIMRRARVYQLLQPGQPPLADRGTRLVVTFASAAELRREVTGGELPPGTYGVLYDPEAWSFTPEAEQRDPVAAATAAAAAAHSRGLAFMVSPALNLVTVMNPGGTGLRWKQFLELNLLGRLAAVADVVEIQAQSLERDAGSYANLVRTGSGQVRAANKRTQVLAGLSTNPPGEPVTSQQLTAAVRVTADLADGYWLNIPGRGPRCPTCNSQRPGIAIQLLQDLLGQRSGAFGK